jgi:hypothetical protein
MCKVSNKFKLCTCKTDDVEKLCHYWIFYRQVPGKDERMPSISTCSRATGICWY